MNEAMKNIMARRSVREFSDKPISADVLKEITEAGIAAPSGMNRKTWHFTIVTDQKKIADLAKAIGGVIDRKDYNFYQPTALIIPSNDPENHLGADDNACAMQNIMLAAQSFGVGSVWINQLKGICNEPTIRTQLDTLKIPGNYVVFGLAALGFPKNDFPPAHEFTGNYDIV